MSLETSTLAASPRLRRSRTGPESEMVSAAIAAGLPFNWLEQAITFQEPELPSGAPDILLLKMRRHDTQVAVTLTEHELKLLHFVSSRRKSSLSDVTSLLCWTPKVAKSAAASLVLKDLLELSGDRISSAPAAKSFLAREIVAIEAKIGEWKRALCQAQRNLWFASQSYILLTGSVSISAMDAAASAGVGILRYDGERTEELVKPEKMRLPGSYASWLVSMWAHHEARA